MATRMSTDVAHTRWWQTFEVVFGIPFLAAIALQLAVPLSLPRGFLTPAILPAGAALIIVGAVVRQLDLPVLIFRHADSHLSLVDLPWPLEGGVHEDRQRGTADETRTPERQNPGTSGRPRRHECPHRPQV